MEGSNDNMLYDEVNIVQKAKQLIRNKRGTAKDIERQLELTPTCAKRIFRHLKFELTIPFHEETVTELSQLTYAQEHYVYHIISCYGYLPNFRIASIASERIGRKISKNLISSLKEKQDLVMPVFRADNGIYPHDFLISGLDYAVDLETAEITDDLLFLCKKSYQFLAGYYNGKFDDIYLTWNLNIQPKRELFINYDFSVAMGKNKQSFVNIIMDGATISHYIKLFENIKNQFLQQHKNTVTIVSEYSQKIQLAFNHAARCFTNFKFKYIIIPPGYANKAHPLNGVFRSIDRALIDTGRIDYSDMDELIKEVVHEYSEEEFENNFENHIKWIYKNLFNGTTHATA